MPDKDKDTIAKGVAAWNRLKQSNSFEDWLAIGEALMVGRRLCMKQVGADKPRGIRYVMANGAWLKETGFLEISKSSRAKAMQCAENEAAVRAWIKTLPPAGRPMVNPDVIWRNFLAAKLGKNKPPPWRGRTRIQEATALQVRDDVRAAVNDLAQRKRYGIAPAILDEIAHAAFVAAMNAVDLAVPERVFRNVTYANAGGDKVTVPRIELGNGKRATVA